MKAVQLLRRMLCQGDVSVEMVVWALPKATADRPHKLKYRLHCGRAGECIVRYDNESGKGDHVHYGKREAPYRFVSLAMLIADFKQDCARLSGWRWDE